MSSEAESRPLIRRAYVYTGRVQGVGFRYSTCDEAKSFDVSGYVRNLPSGQVEMVVEGLEPEVERFQEAVASRMRGHIRDVSVSEQGATGEFRDFDVRY